MHSYYFGVIWGDISALSGVKIRLNLWSDVLESLEKTTDLGARTLNEIATALKKTDPSS